MAHLRVISKVQKILARARKHTGGHITYTHLPLKGFTPQPGVGIRPPLGGGDQTSSRAENKPQLWRGSNLFSGGDQTSYRSGIQPLIGSNLYSGGDQTSALAGIRPPLGRGSNLYSGGDQTSTRAGDQTSSRAGIRPLP